MPEPISDAEFLRELARWFQRTSRHFGQQITHTGQWERGTAQRLEEIADEIDPDTNAEAEDV